MQKKNTKASILIWAIFLSLIISVTFISISTKINKNLRNNSNFSEKIKINTQIKNIINNSIINWSFTDQTLSNLDEIIFDKSNEIIVWLKQNENYLSKINNSSNIWITIINWWPIKYLNLTSSWIISTNDTINTSSWDLEIINLWWYTKIKITSNYQNDFLSQYRNYKIIKKIWNKELIKTKWKIKNF